MAIQFSNVSGADFNGVQFVIHGDDVHNSVSVNLTKPPFNINFNGVLPTSFETGQLQEGVTATAAIAINGDGDAILTETFSIPLPGISDTNSSGTSGAAVIFHYDSIA